MRLDLQGLDARDLRVESFSESIKGGSLGARITHMPSGKASEICFGKSILESRQLAFADLMRKMKDESLI